MFKKNLIGSHRKIASASQAEAEALRKEHWLDVVGDSPKGERYILDIVRILIKWDNP
jgi:hypothetical protein